MIKDAFERTPQNVALVPALISLPSDQIREVLREVVGDLDGLALADPRVSEVNS